MCFDAEKMELQFSAAYNPMYLVRNDEILEYRGDRMPIGFLGKEDQHFSSQLINIEAGDIVYLFSDGYADQFGGERGKKLKYRALQEYILDVHSKSMEEQHDLLEAKFNKWKGDMEQIDDVVLMGVRF